MGIQLEAKVVAAAAHKAFCEARKGSRKEVYGPGPHLDDLLSYDQLSEEEQETWEIFVSRICGIAPEMEGRHIGELVNIAKHLWTEVTRLDGEVMFSGHGHIGLTAFVKMVTLFLSAVNTKDEEDFKEDLSDILDDPFDWLEWGSKRQKEQDLIHGRSSSQND
jgi:hypothetical protein